MTDQEFNVIKQKIDREFPVRCQLAELAGRPKINVKNYKALESFDLTIADLFLEITLKFPENEAKALTIIKDITK